MSGCKARVYCDTMVCVACGLSWDIKDKDTPLCNPKPSLPRDRRMPPDRRRHEKTIKPEQWAALKQWAEDGFDDAKRPEGL